MWTIFKALLNLLQYCFCFIFCFFGHEACGILASQPGFELSPPALEGAVLTTGPPGKSLLSRSIWKSQADRVPQLQSYRLEPPLATLWLLLPQSLESTECSGRGQQTRGKACGEVSGQQTQGGVSCSPCSSPFPEMDGSLSRSSALIKWSEGCGF